MSPAVGPEQIRKWLPVQNLRSRTAAIAVGFVVTLGASLPAHAAPILINTVLTGDPRPENPDDLRVLVSISGDTDSNLTTWTVSLDMASAHPDARLNEFGFNLRTPPSYSFNIGSFNLPYRPTIGTLDGSGSTTFLLTLDDPSGNRNDLSHGEFLTFTVTRSTGTFSMDDFLLAPESCSSNTFLGCNQLGAHIQALGPNAQDSGVAVGNYQPPTASVPEPGTLLVVTLGCALSLVRRRRPSISR